MIGSKDRMPKRARYPLFLSGLAVTILGSLFANSRGAGAASIAGIAAVGFLLMLSSVVFR